MITAASLVGCGKKQTVEDSYEYTASFKQSTLRLNGMYMNAEYTENGTYYGIENIFEGNEDTGEGTIKPVLHIMNLETGEDKTTELDLGDSGTAAGDYTASIYAIRPFGDKFYAFLGKWDDKTYETSYLLRVYGSDGKIIKEASLQSIMGSDGYLNTDAIVVLDDGRILLTTDEGIVCIDENVKQLFTLRAGYHVSYLIKSGSGDVYCSYYEEGGESVAKINPSTGTLENPMQVSNLNGIYADGDSIFVATDLSVREINPATKEAKSLWNWLDVDISDSGIKEIGKNEDGTYRVVTVNNDEKKMTFETATVSYVPVGSNSKKKIVLGCSSLDWSIKDLIRTFNKTNDEYRISVKCYSEDYPDWSEANDKFKMDISSGNAFDIVCTDAYDLQSFIESKALANLSEYFDNDFKREDFFTKVLDGFSKDGKLYAVTPSFSLQTMIVSDETAAGRTSWTIDDIMELRKKNPNKTFLAAGDKQTALTMMLYYSLDDFVDTDKGECCFDSDRFKTLLEFANTFPDEFNYDDFDEWQAVADGDVLLAVSYIYDLSLSDLQIYDKLFNGKTVLIGFPSDKGVGNRISPGSAYAISSKSKNKEGAWEFLKMLFGDDFQRDGWNIPVVKKIYNERVEEFIHPSEDFHGGVSAVGNGSQVIEIGNPTRAQYDLVEAAIENATGSGFYDEKMFEIVTEETAPFFKGQKSADEVADLIQKRVRLYLQEKK